MYRIKEIFNECVINIAFFSYRIKSCIFIYIGIVHRDSKPEYLYIKPKFLHIGIVHRDLKPENLLYSSDNPKDPGYEVLNPKP